MDADQFDTLARSLTTPRSRRRLARVVSGLSLGGLLTALGLGEAAAATRIGGSPCTKDSQCKTGRCLRNDTCSCSARFPKCRGTGTVCYRRKCCTPECAGKLCGDDGCGGSCGSCTGGSCDAGSCNCSGGQQFCRGACRDGCDTDSEARNPTSCECCRTHNSICSFFIFCCGGTCEQFDPPDPAGTGVCEGLAQGDPCSFDAECASNNCEDSGPQAGRCGP